MRVAVLALLCLILAAPALAGSGRPAAKLTLCDTDEHSVTFTGDMRRLDRSTTLLQMRFTLQLREKGRWARVIGADGFDTWLSSAIGTRRFVYDKNVVTPPAGGVFRSVIRFRWRNADGKIAGRQLRMTPACRVPDDRPDLHATKLRVRPGSSPDTREYVVRVANRGDGDAEAFAVGLAIGGVVQPDQTLPELIAGDEDALRFEAPPCTSGGEVVAVVDTGGVVDEARESDNTRSFPCPLP